MSHTDETEIRIGVSSCLLGKEVRFDAGHKRDRFLTDVLSKFVTFVPVCPEVEVGMGVPREAVRLVGSIDNPRMVGVRSGDDWTSRMVTYAARRVKSKSLSKLSGFILKSKSPSCGFERVKVYSGTGAPRNGTGLFAAALIEQHPELPVEEEGRLNDPVLRENFIERVFAYHRLETLFATPFSRRAMINFHTAHKLLLLAHSTERYRQLGRLVAAIKEVKPSEFKTTYRHEFMSALGIKATVKKNTNVLEHVAGYLKGKLTKSEKSDVHETIRDYHESLIPLIVPITLLRHLVRKYDIEYVKGQYYLNPHPKELMLRNHV